MVFISIHVNENDSYRINSIKHFSQCFASDVKICLHKVGDTTLELFFFEILLEKNFKLQNDSKIQNSELLIVLN